MISAMSKVLDFNSRTQYKVEKVNNEIQTYFWPF